MSPKKPKSAKRTARDDERKRLRIQLFQAGWVVGEKSQTKEGVTLELWPVPHTPESAAAAGIEPRRVHGKNQLEAMRNAYSAADEQQSAESGTGTEGKTRTVLSTLKERLTGGE